MLGKSTYDSQKAKGPAGKSTFDSMSEEKKREGTQFKEMGYGSGFGKVKKGRAPRMPRMRGR